MYIWRKKKNLFLLLWKTVYRVLWIKHIKTGLQDTSQNMTNIISPTLLSDFTCKLQKSHAVHQILDSKDIPVFLIM